MNYLYAFVAACAILVAVEQYGEHRVNVAWDLERARQQAIADQAEKADAAAKIASEAQFKKDIENAKYAAVANWAKSHGLLSDGSPVSGSCGGQADSSGKSDGSAGQSGSGDRITQFAQRCALDALQVLRWQEWAVREGLESN